MNQAAMMGPCGPRPRPAGAGVGAAPGVGADAAAAGVGAALGVGAGVAGAGPRSGWNRYTLWLDGSTAMVFAPANVVTVSTTVYLSGESWWTTVTSPCPPLG